jgi:histidinol-phosphate aminotransferase
LDADEVTRVLEEHEPSIIFLASPNNPSGMIEPLDVIDQIVTRANGLVVVDEAYGQFAPYSALDLVTDDRSLAVTRTYSKTWSMAAARLGYLVGPTWLVDDLKVVTLPYHLDALKQAAGRVALRYTEEMEKRITVVVAERERILAEFDRMPVESWPSSANFVLFRPLHVRADDVWQGLVDRSVLIRNTSSWPGIEGCLRVTIGTPAENDVFLAALTEVLFAG